MSHWIISTLIILLSLITIISGEEEITTITPRPRITYSKDVSTKYGENVTLNCGVEGVDLEGISQFKISWNKIDESNPTDSLPLTIDERILILSEKYSIEREEGTYNYKLSISNITKDDLGVYRCLVNFGEDQKVHADINVLVETPAFFLHNETKYLTVNEGDAITINCQPGGSPEPDVFWERIDEVVPYYGGQLLQSNRLEIPSLERNHKGRYVCHADNGLGDPARAEIVLDVHFEPEIRVKDSILYAGPVQSVTLTCNAFGWPAPDVAWYKNDEIIYSTSNLRVHKESTKIQSGDYEQVTILLTIGEVTDIDLGDYTCKAVNSVGNSEKTTTVAIKQPPLIESSKKTEVVYDVEEVLSRNALPTVLECNAKGQPVPEYRWTKNGQPLVWQADARYSLEEGTGNLLIENVNSLDNGYYQCIAYNELGTAKGDVIHLVNSSRIVFDNFKQDTFELKAELGRPYEIKCPKAESYPEPKLSWIKAYDLENGSTNVEFINEEHLSIVDGILYFTQVTPEHDTKKGGFKFLCIGSTDLNPQDLSIGYVINLEVIDPIEGPHKDDSDVQTVKLFNSPEKINMMSGEANKIHCVFGGEPSPSVLWYRDEEELIESNEFGFENNGMTLVFKNVKLEDSGSYSCLASNGVGDPSRSQFQVHVDASPKFQMAMEPLTVTTGDTVEITCAVNSTADLTFRWFFNAQPITKTGNRRVIEGNTLTIFRATTTDIGNYACNATNSLGYAFGQTVLHVMPRSQSKPTSSNCGYEKDLVKEVEELKAVINILREEVQDQLEQQASLMDQLLQNLGPKLKNI